jgi:hypothetical protein
VDTALRRWDEPTFGGWCRGWVTPYAGWMDAREPLTTAQADAEQADAELTPTQAAEIEARLRSLGYID